jgi:MFS family permease
MWPQLGAPIGFILANGFFLLLTVWFQYDSTAATPQDAFLVWGWRIPFLLSIVMVGIGLYVRLMLQETPVFARAVERGERVKSPLAHVFRHNFRELVVGMFIMVATYGVFYLMTTWVLSYAIGKVELGFLGIGYRDFLKLQLVAVLFFAAFIPVAGHLADRVGRRKLLLVVTVGIILFGLSFKTFLAPEVMGVGAEANKGLMLAFLCLGMALMGLSFGPMSALLPELFPTHTRYTGSGVSYNMASILGAALTPFVATWLARNHGVGAVGLYMSALGVLSLVALYVSKESAHTDLDTMLDETVAKAVETTSP